MVLSAVRSKVSGGASRDRCKFWLWLFVFVLSAPSALAETELSSDELLVELDKAMLEWRKSSSSFRGFQIDFTWDYKTDEGEATTPGRERFAVTESGLLFHEGGIGDDLVAKDRRVVNQEYEFMVGGLRASSPATLLSGTKTKNGNERLRSSMNNRIASVGCAWHIYLYPAIEVVDVDDAAIKGTVVKEDGKEILRLECRFPSGFKLHKGPCILWGEMDRDTYIIHRSGIIYPNSNVADTVDSTLQNSEFGVLAKKWVQRGSVEGKVTDTTIQEFQPPVPCKFLEDEAFLGHYGISETVLDERKPRSFGIYLIAAALILCLLGFAQKRFIKSFSSGSRFQS